MRLLPFLSPPHFFMPTGTIKKKTDKGFGFISVEGGQDLFFHSKSCADSFDGLQEGQAVSFDTESSDKGPRAINVKAA
jgi:cold shock protein